MKSCPACNKSIDDHLEECPYCLVIFSKWAIKTQYPAANVSSVKANKKILSPSTLIYSIIFICVFFLIYSLNKTVKERTKGVGARDTSKMANRLALKALGMDTTFEFAKFVRAGDAESVKKYLSAGYSPNAIIDRYTLLEWAIIKKNKDMFIMLLNNGADVNSKDPDGVSALQFAVRVDPKDAHFVRELITAGAVIDPGLMENQIIVDALASNDSQPIK